jgi:hypothetical protein
MVYRSMTLQLIIEVKHLARPPAINTVERDLERAAAVALLQP